MSLEQDKEFDINRNITLKLENNETVVYIAGKRFIQCRYLLIHINLEDDDHFEGIESIDEVTEKLDKSLEPYIDSEGKIHRKTFIPPEVEFWGHCSNLQVWAENKYDTRLLHSNISFPLLKKLADIGDQKAKFMLKEEIAKRLDSRYLNVVLFLFNQGYLDYLDDDYIKDFIKQIEKDMNTNSEDENIILGLLNLHLWETGNAIEVFNHCIKINPKNFNTWKYLAKIYEEIGDYKNEKATYLRTLQISSNNFLFWCKLGCKLYNRMEYVLSLKALHKGYDLNSKDPELLFGLGLSYLGNKNFLKSKFYLEKALKYQRSNERIWEALALVSIKLRQYKNAINAYKKALEIQPKNEQYWINLGKTYQLIGDLNNRNKAYEKADHLRRSWGGKYSY